MDIADLSKDAALSSTLLVSMRSQLGTKLSQLPYVQYSRRCVTMLRVINHTSQHVAHLMFSHFCF